MDTKPIIVLINGPIASGKTSVGLSLAKQCEHGVHLDVDIIRNFVKGGFIEEDTLYKEGDDIFNRFQLKIQAIKTTIQLARWYTEAGYSVFISDPVYLKELEDIYRTKLSDLSNTKIWYIYLQEAYEELIRRVRTRSTPESEPDSKVQHYFSLFESFDKSKWTVVQTNSLNKDEILKKILSIIHQS